MPAPKLRSALAPEAQADLEHLSSRLREFHNSDFAATYFEASEAGNEIWSPQMRAHWHLKQSIPKGSRVVDLGCGTAHPCRNLADREICYTGVDWSEKQIARNKDAMPESDFIVSSLYKTPLPDESFDVSMSLYAVEHLVWPHRLLDEMYRLTRPNGAMAILTPPFRFKNYLKSFDYGLSARPFKEKLRTGRLVDAALHLYQHRIAYPWLLKRRYASQKERNRFLIHLEPVCFQYETWFPDADAVYLADSGEIVDYFESKSCRALEEWPSKGYVLVRKRA